jgi:hypothetical protein
MLATLKQTRQRGQFMERKVSLVRVTRFTLLYLISFFVCDFIIINHIIVLYWCDFYYVVI